MAASRIDRGQTMARNLARLRKVDLRDIWGHEASDFNHWLAQSENLDLLGEEIGVDIKLIQPGASPGASVGEFTLDILAEEETSGRKIVIENQLEDTDHDHLGKIITYASGYDAGIVVWLVRDVRKEHQQAIEWLNQHTDEKTGFFLVKIELWQIEGSNPAPKFEVVVSPNEWAKTLKTSPAGDDLTDTKIQQLDFWTKFKSFVAARDPKIRLQTPRPQHWYNFSIGSSDAHISLTINTREETIGCELYIEKNRDLFNFLREQKEEIEREIGEEAEWIEAPVASRIKIKKEVPGVFDQPQAESDFDWLYQKTILFQKVFSKQIRDFKKQ